MALLAAMRRSLAELDLGLKGDLTMSEAGFCSPSWAEQSVPFTPGYPLGKISRELRPDTKCRQSMERLMGELARDAVPSSWALLAYPSLRPLSSWMANLIARAQQLAEWTSDFQVPKVRPGCRVRMQHLWSPGKAGPPSYCTCCCF